MREMSQDSPSDCPEAMKCVAFFVRNRSMSLGTTFLGSWVKHDAFTWGILKLSLVTISWKHAIRTNANQRIVLTHCSGRFLLSGKGFGMRQENKASPMFRFFVVSAVLVHSICIQMGFHVYHCRFQSGKNMEAAKHWSMKEGSRAK